MDSLTFVSVSLLVWYLTGKGTGRDGSDMFAKNLSWNVFPHVSASLLPLLQNIVLTTALKLFLSTR